MKTDAQLKMDIDNEMKWDPSIQPAHVGVTVNDGVVTLTGHIGTFSEKRAIERAVQRVAGVRVVAVELDVKLSADHQRSDSELAAAVEKTFELSASVPADQIDVKVEKGWIQLDGEVDWDFQRNLAEAAVRDLAGVVGIRNRIMVSSHRSPAASRNASVTP